MVGLAEAAADKTMVRSHKGIDGAFVVDVITNGKSGVAVQLEGSNFETVWQLMEGDENGILDLNKVRRWSGRVVLFCFVLMLGNSTPCFCCIDAHALYFDFDQLSFGRPFRLLVGHVGVSLMINWCSCMS